MHELRNEEEKGILKYFTRMLPDYEAYSISDIIDNMESISKGKSVYLETSIYADKTGSLITFGDHASRIEVIANLDSFYRSTRKGLHFFRNFGEVFSGLPNRCRLYDIILKKSDIENLVLYSFDYEARIQDNSFSFA